MPRYFFDIDDGVRNLRDEEGVVLDNCEHARREAIGILAQLANSMLPNGNNHSFQACVRDETGKPIYEATLDLKNGWIG
nr:hypothetical protein [Methylobacterium sp. L1A1]